MMQFETLAATHDATAILSQRGEFEAQHGNAEGALACFKQVLRLDSANETALWRCAMLTQDVYEARALLKRLLAVNPGHAKARAFFALADRRCSDADMEAAQSPLYAQWERKAAASHDIAIPRIGEYLLEMDAVTPLQVQAALQFQEEERQRGKVGDRLGQILVIFGYISPAQLADALDTLQTDFNNRLF